MNPEILGYTMERLLENNAKDVYFTPIQMKKNRPAIKLEVIVGEEDIEKISKIIFSETSTIGLRLIKVDRIRMDREILRVNTAHGQVRVKKSKYGEIEKYSPEYEDCREIAKKTKIPLEKIYRDALDGL